MKIIKLLAIINVKTYQILICVCILGLSLSCSEPVRNVEPDFSAIPHTDALPSTELSKEDKAKLRNASGKTISKINTVDLQNMLGASTDNLYIYAFWKSDCKECIQNIANLSELYAGKTADKMQIITINIGDTQADVNLAVRTENIAFETYQLKILKQNWSKLIDENWDGSAPALFMVNKSEDIFLKYYKAMDISEMEAIIQTLVI